jgi:hypothetical protein
LRKRPRLTHTPGNDFPFPTFASQLNIHRQDNNSCSKVTFISLL